MALLVVVQHPVYSSGLKRSEDAEDQAPLHYLRLDQKKIRSLLRIGKRGELDTNTSEDSTIASLLLAEDAGLLEVSRLTVMFGCREVGIEKKKGFIDESLVNV